MKGKKIKCLICSAIFTLLFIGSLCFPIFAAEYGKQYPAYLKQSAGCFIECQTNLGKGSIVLPRNYQYEYIGFSGSGSNVMNLQSSSISGQLVLETVLLMMSAQVDFLLFNIIVTPVIGVAIMI